MERALELKSCAECGAALPPADKQCWLCGRIQSATDRTAKQTGRAKPSPSSVRVLWLTTIAVTLALLLVGLGTWQAAPGLAIVLTVAVAPALLAIRVAHARSSSLETPQTLGERVNRVLLSLAMFLAGLGLLVLAAVIALFVWCLVAIGQQA